MKQLISILFLTAISFSAWAEPDPNVILQPDAFGTPYTSSFKVKVKFSEPVTMFGKEELNVTNVTIDSIIGSQADYLITLTPKNPGPMTILIPANVVRSLSTGTPNKASNQLKITALNPALNPSANFDLTPWALTLPFPADETGAAISISNEALVGDPLLNTGYTSPPYFYTDLLSGSMNFFAPINGATTSGSLFPRSSLLEKLKVRGQPDTWMLNTFDSNTLTASLLITQVPPSKKIIIGEIQDKGNTDASGQVVATKDLVKIYYNLNLFDDDGKLCNGCIYAQIRPVPAQEQYLKTVLLATNILLNKLFIYQITLLSDGTLKVKSNDRSFSYKLNTSADNTIGWGAQSFLFKAGVAIQDQGPSLSLGGSASFYSLELKHKGCPSERTPL